MNPFLKKFKELLNLQLIKPENLQYILFRYRVRPENRPFKFFSILVIGFKTTTTTTQSDQNNDYCPKGYKPMDHLSLLLEIVMDIVSSENQPAVHATWSISSSQKEI